MCLARAKILPAHLRTSRCSVHMNTRDAHTAALKAATFSLAQQGFAGFSLRTDAHAAQEL